MTKRREMQSLPFSESMKRRYFVWSNLCACVICCACTRTRVCVCVWHQRVCQSAMPMPCNVVTVLFIDGADATDLHNPALPCDCSQLFCRHQKGMCTDAHFEPALCVCASLLWPGSSAARNVGTTQRPNAPFPLLLCPVSQLLKSFCLGKCRSCTAPENFRNFGLF